MISDRDTLQSCDGSINKYVATCFVFMALFGVVTGAARMQELMGRYFSALPFTNAQPSFVPVLLFFAIAYAFTWSLHGLIILFHLSFRQAPKPCARILHFAGLCGPLVAALLSAYLFHGQTGVSDLLNSALEWRVEWIWYFLAIAPIGIIYMAATVLYRKWHGKPIALFKKQKSGLLVLLLSQVWVVIAEEFGWRGFAIPHLQALIGWLGAAFIIGVLWASWHLPMFFVPGSNQYKSSFPQYLFVLSIWSFFTAMLYYQTNGSLLLCMIFHAAANFWGLTINVPDESERLVLLLYLPMLLTAVALLPV